MSKAGAGARNVELWAHFRFSVVGPLLAAPPGPSELSRALQDLSRKKWKHPITGASRKFGKSTIERWYYAAKNEKQDPVKVLKRKVRRDSGTYPSITETVRKLLHAQYRQYPGWTHKLHWDNLQVLLSEAGGGESCPSYDTLHRYMNGTGLRRRKRKGPVGSPGGARAEERYERREVRSYESMYVSALWHLDFYHGSLPVLLPTGKYKYPLLLGIMDDRSRLCCHAQWYLSEQAEDLVHGLIQAFEKRDLPRAVMMDNGSAMVAAETTWGLQRLGIVQELTLPYSPEQNGKQEVFWAQVSGRLLAMLEGTKDLTLSFLNEATQAWVEMEYNRKLHTELAAKPIDVFVNSKDVSRPCPPDKALGEAFTQQLWRTQRRSDGTITLYRRRFEIPSQYAHMERILLRYAQWDLTRVYMCDTRTGEILSRLYPQDKAKNAEGARRTRQSCDPSTSVEYSQDAGVAPLLLKLMRAYKATGLPPAYITKDIHGTGKENNI